jgi:hypothetical protein
MTQPKIDFKDMQKILFRKVAELEFLIRTKNCLRAEEIIYVGDLVQKTEEELMAVRNFGQKCLNEIKEYLKQFDLELGMLVPDWHLLTAEQLVDEFNELLKSRYFPRVPPPPPELDDSTLVKLFLTVEELDLSVRALRCLQKASITYVGDLVQKLEAELLKMRNFGRKSLNEVKKELAPMGLHLAMLVPNWTPDYIDAKLKLLEKEIEQERLRRAKEFRKAFGADVNTLEDELWHLTSVLESTRNREIIVKLLGWDGKGKNILEAMGQEYGMTRERVRQIRNKFCRKLRRGKTVYLPILTRALEFVGDASPGLADEIEATLSDHGLARAPFHLDGLLTAAEGLGIKVPFRIVKLRRKRIVVPPEATEVPKLIVQLAKKVVRHWGIATISDIAAQVQDETEQPITADFLMDILSSRKDFKWLDQPGGWFWLSSVEKNRALNRTRKILSVASQIDISELRSGIGRSRRMNGFAPPRRVLLELCRQVTWCAIDGNTILADSDLNSEEILSENEIIMHRVLKEHGDFGPVMNHEKLEDRCLEQGMNQITIRIYMGDSPIIARHAQGVYGLRGARIDPFAVESLMPPRKRKKALEDFGWSEGKIWVALKLNRGLITSGVFGVPADMKRYLQGNFVLKTADGALIGDLKVKDVSGWSLGALFRRRGGEPGDYLILTFDPASRQATAYIGDEDLLDEFRPE